MSEVSLRFPLRDSALASSLHILLILSTGSAYQEGYASRPIVLLTVCVCGEAAPAGNLDTRRCYVGLCPVLSHMACQIHRPVQMVLLGAMHSRHNHDMHGCCSMRRHFKDLILPKPHPLLRCMSVSAPLLFSNFTISLYQQLEATPIDSHAEHAQPFAPPFA